MLKYNYNKYKGKLALSNLNSEINELKYLKKSINNLKRSYIEIKEDDQFKVNIKEIIDLLSKIYVAAFNDSKNTARIRNYGDIYLPVLINLVNKYNILKKEKVSSKEMTLFFERMNALSNTLKEHFKVKYNSMLNDEISSNDAEIKALLYSIK